MRSKKARAIVLVSFLLLALFADMNRPQPAEAGSNLGLVIGVSIGIFVVVIAIGTWLVYGRQYKPESDLAPHYSDQLAMREDANGLRFAPHCRTPDGQVSVICW